MKICIDPGHGGKDPGYSKFGLKEKDINLDIALKLENFLREHGFKVYMTRRIDKTLSLIERADIINGYNCDVSVSIHNNASNSEKTSGCEVIYPANSSRGKDLGQFIINNLGKIDLVKRKVYKKLNSKGNDYYYIIRNVKNLSIIVEGAFVTNKENNGLLQKDEFRTKMTKAIGKGVMQFSEKHFGKYQKHWAEDNYKKLKNEGLIFDDHDLNSYVTWGEFSTILTRLLDKNKDNTLN